jgi:bifunctional UDP-N-acetylglucosamine pyrophosphorylase/glucosamine-1-phosphate N-acetyltransferase
MLMGASKKTSHFKLSYTILGKSPKGDNQMSGALSKPLTCVILAAGQGKRMGEGVPKPLRKLAGRPLLGYVLDAAQELNPVSVNIVTSSALQESPDFSALVKSLGIDLSAGIVQKEARGTGHAVQTFLDTRSKKFEGELLVLLGDVPFLKPSSLKMLSDKMHTEGAVLGLLGFKTPNPKAYGRLALNAEGFVIDIVEAKCNRPHAELSPLCNSGVMWIGPAALPLLENLPQNPNGEYYLTDLVRLAYAQGLKTSVHEVPESEVQGINTLDELALAEQGFQKRRRRQFLDQGVQMTDPETVHFAFDTHVEAGSVLYPSIFFHPGVVVKAGATILPFCVLGDTHVEPHVTLGPFAHLRGGTHLGSHSVVGNFVEIKASKLGAGTKAKHHAYVGDASVGEKVNISAGTIFCNYDGNLKHKTVVGARSFVGANTSLIAPLTLGAESFVAAGSVVSEDVPSGAFTITRAPQVIKSRKP